MLTKFDTYVLKTKLRAPFTGSWKAVNVARIAENKHFTNCNQRFAVDWLKVDSTGSVHSSDGKKLSHYHSYASNVLAVADGVVVCVVDGIPEHPIGGTPDHYNVPGNQIVIDIGNGEFAFYAHLIPGQSKVRVGEWVCAGQPLGKVGNSGNSTEPHLHFQVMDNPRLIEAASMPLRFWNVWVNGTSLPSAEVKEGDILAPLFDQ